MTTAFTAYEAMLSAAVNDQFGEAFLFVGYKLPDDRNAIPVQDPSRPLIVAIGVWVEQTKSTPLPARGAVQDDNAHRFNDGHPMVHVDESDMAWKPQRFDRVVRVSDGAVYQVSVPPRPDGMGRVMIPLSMRMRVVTLPPGMIFNIVANSQYLGTLI